MISYKQWKKRVTTIVSAVYPIDDEVCLLQHTGALSGETGPFRADCTLAILLNSGELSLTIDMVPWQASAPCMVTILPNQIFQIHRLSDCMEAHTILMSEKFSDSLFDEYALFNSLRPSIADRPLIDLNGGIGTAFDKYIDLLKDLANSPLHVYRLEAAKHLTLSMFYGVAFSIHDLSRTKSTDRQTMLFKRFEKALRQHYKSQREVAFYAEKLCVSPKYLSAVVRKQSGKSALRCINEYVLNECQALLLSTDLTLQEIANQLHFPSQSVFSKFFKRMTGLSPRDYRKQTLR